MPDKYSKIEPKISKITIIVIIGIILLVAGIMISFKPTNSELVFSSYSGLASDEFTEDHPFHKVTFEGSFLNKGLETIIKNNEIVVVFISFPDCPACQSHIGAIQKYFDSEGINEYVSTIHYLNPIDDKEGFDLFDEAYIEVIDTTPQILVFKNGEIVQTFIFQSADVSTIINRSVRDFFRDAKEVLSK